MNVSIDRKRFYTGTYQFIKKFLVYLSRLIWYFLNLPLFFLYFLIYLLYLILHILYFLYRFVPEKYYPKLLYPIEDEIASATTRVIFTRKKHNNQLICLKLWQLYDQKICNDKLVRRNVDYLLEGFKFNRRFAQDVCLGIVPVKVDDDDNKKIYRGRLIEKPEKSLLKPRVEYAFMMRHLNEDSRLDSQLKPRDQSLCIRAMLEFLAREVAVMHIQLEKSARNRGSSDSILSKLKINIELFEDALNKLIHDNKHFTKYRWITSLMVQACKSYTEFFEQRREEDHIKRCHGDLKVSNLWINPEKSYFCGLKKYPQQLIALDCVDFNPEFCHIDTLSDVAMLVIDLEMHLSDWYRQEGEELAQYFLECYLYKMKEDGERWKPLLEYYMTEKSLVCTYVSILYDTQPEVGKRYLEVALAHAQRLQKLLKSTEYTSTLRQIAIAAKESI